MGEGEGRGPEFGWDTSDENFKELEAEVDEANAEYARVYGEIENLKDEFGKVGPAFENEMTRRGLREKMEAARQKRSIALDRLKDFMDRKEKSSGG